MFFVAIVRRLHRRILSLASQTHLNVDSSRSHSAFFINVCKYTDNTYGIGEMVGKVIICDLAGSERMARTQTTGSIVLLVVALHSAHPPRPTTLARAHTHIGNGNSEPYNGDPWVQMCYRSRSCHQPKLQSHRQW